MYGDADIILCIMHIYVQRKLRKKRQRRGVFSRGARMDGGVHTKEALQKLRSFREGRRRGFFSCVCVCFFPFCVCRGQDHMCRVKMVVSSWFV